MDGIARGETHVSAHKVAGSIGICQRDAEHNGADLDEKVVNLSSEIAAADRGIPIKYFLQRLGAAASVHFTFTNTA